MAEPIEVTKCDKCVVRLAERAWDASRKAKAISPQLPEEAMFAVLYARLLDKCWRPRKRCAKYD